MRSVLLSPQKLHSMLSSGSLNRGRFVVLDASFVLPNQGKDAFAVYQNAHIKDARYFDIRAASDPNSVFPNTLPDADHFSYYVGAKGISREDTVIVYGQDGIKMGAARAWWMFKTFGHEEVYILNGGLPAWVKAGYPVVSSDAQSTIQQKKYNAVFQSSFYIGIKNVENSIGKDGFHILDARNPARFSGKVPEPRANMRAGHIPKSINVPADIFIQSDTGFFKSKDNLNSIISDIGINEGDSIIATCGSGITACVIFLAFYEAEYKNISVFDGSWSEWGHKASAYEIAKSS